MANRRSTLHGSTTDTLNDRVSSKHSIYQACSNQPQSINLCHIGNSNSRNREISQNNSCMISKNKGMGNNRQCNRPTAPTMISTTLTTALTKYLFFLLFSFFLFLWIGRDDQAQHIRGTKEKRKRTGIRVLYRTQPAQERRIKTKPATM